MNVVVRLWFVVIVVHCAFAKNKDQEIPGNNFVRNYNHQNDPPTGKPHSNVRGDYDNEETGSTSITSTNSVERYVSDNKWTSATFSVQDGIKNNEPSILDRRSHQDNVNLRDLNTNVTDTLSVTSSSSSLQFRNNFMTDTKDIIDGNTKEINNDSNVTTSKKDNAADSSQNEVTTDAGNVNSGESSSVSTDSWSMASTDMFTETINESSTSNVVGVSISNERDVSNKEETEVNSTTIQDDFLSESSTFPSLYFLSTTIVSTTDINTATESNSVTSINEEISSNPTILPSERSTCLGGVPEVNFTTINASSLNVFLEWEDGNSTDCIIDHYTINLNNREYTATSLSLSIDGLYACTEYNVTITATSSVVTGPTTERTFQTIVTEIFSNYNVTSLTITKNSDGDISVNWGPLDAEMRQCVTGYYVNWWDETSELAGSSSTLDPSQNSYVIPLIGCVEYKIQVYAKSGEQYNGLDIIETFPAEPLPNSAPEIVEIYYDKTEVSVTWETDNKTENACNVTAIVATCNAPLDSNLNASWIIWQANATVTVTEQAEDSRYPMNIVNLSPYTKYNCEAFVTNIAGNSPTTSFPIQTMEDVPSKPLSLSAVNVGPNQFTLQWVEPEIIPGVLQSYGLHIDNGGPQQMPAKECSNNFTDHFFVVPSYDTTFFFQDGLPYYNYKILLYGVDSAGNGTVATLDVLTTATEPDIIENPTVNIYMNSEDEIYRATVIVEFEPPCNVNDLFKYYEVGYSGVRNGYSNHEDSVRTNKTTTEIALMPARDYTINITVVTESFVSSPVVVPSIHSRPGVPILVANMTAPSVNDATTAHFTLQKDSFSDINGDIVAYAIFLSTTSDATNGFGFWNYTDDTWPTLTENARQLTPNFWNPFQDGALSVDFAIGVNGSCNSQNYCNPPLAEDTKYWLLVRALTSAAYKDSPLLYFQTEMLNDLNLALILGLTFGLLALIILLGFLGFLWKRKRKTKHFPEEEKKISTTSPASIPVLKYPVYYANLKEGYNVIKEQYTDIGLRSKEVAGETSFAILPENKRKNRYTNILPYDQTRVTLKIDEDDEISSDYINASYIRGYSGKVEYIATQGPLEHTARDFWKMILQENVSVIVMVSQFIEQSKEKCFQYFPNNHESAYFGESLEVKCSTELHFGTYCVRTLQIRKGTEKREVTHMQFLEWPDFGVPQGSDNMLQFCAQMREKVTKEGGFIVVHCSAGVGRTGTLIALDILLQAIDDHRDINIYKTVFDLRKQRTNMVQTEKQYMFIHTCINDYIEAPSAPPHEVIEERIYENIDVLRTSSLKKNLIESELESAL